MQYTKGKVVGLYIHLSMMLLLCSFSLLTAGCGQSFYKVTEHGHQFRANDAQLIKQGMNQEDVRLTLGTPTIRSKFQNGQAYYYVSSKMRQMAFLNPKEIDRRILAVYFDELEGVKRIANYGLKDGRIFDFVARTTPAASNNEGNILSQMFKNLGNRGSVFEN